MPLSRDHIAEALNTALSIDIAKLGFLCHTGKFENWLRDECAFALQSAHDRHHVAREYEKMDIVAIDPGESGVTMWQLKQGYSMNQWLVDGTTFAWPPRTGQDGRHGDYCHRIVEDLAKSRAAAAVLRNKWNAAELPVCSFMTYSVIHPSGIAELSTSARLTQKYSKDYLRSWQRLHGNSVGGFSGLRTSSISAIATWTVDGQAGGTPIIREPLPGPARLTYSLVSFIWGPF